MKGWYPWILLAAVTIETASLGAPPKGCLDVMQNKILKFFSPPSLLVSIYLSAKLNSHSAYKLYVSFKTNKQFFSDNSSIFIGKCVSIK